MRDLQKGADREKSLLMSDYLLDGYFTPKQWESYLFQIRSIKALMDSGSILEVGCGGGIVNMVLRHLGYAADTLDINKNLNPTYVEDFSKSDYQPPKEFDCVLCAEVLEHIPFEHFTTCITNIRKTTKKYAVVTLPNCMSRRFECGLMINRHYREIGFGRKTSEIAPMHFWELNSDPYCTYKAMTKLLSDFFKIKEEGMVLKNRYHYYYILEKR